MVSTVSYLTFYPPEILALPFYRVEKNFFKTVRKMYQKKHNFALVSKKVQNSCVLQEALWGEKI